MVARRVLWSVHLTAVGIGLGYFLLSLALEDPEGGANIGAGLGLLLLFALGSPWTWLLFAGSDDWSGAGPVALIVGGALLNLVLHGWWVRRRNAVEPA